ncbi:hypothetical protein OEB99_15215 [Actinotalea sp. M2MS4P-6]|uniref:hypothetical protein n=1 Tax=Actinotalea sp. M2MS4P-6 TaxID=2983762 RepID=UPI0021E4A8E1|nr:hypothetical protein [Actinotalea sp. M2MS4P-6]MCV2395663.1 hypothetical protein [Actinotalea sp. M2MS4P-6]
MTIVVRERATRSFAGRRAVRALRVGTGAALQVLAVVVSAPAAVLTLWFLAALGERVAGSEGEPEWGALEWGPLLEGWLLSLALLVSARIVGRRLSRTPRGMVLWLRRFRHRDATGAVASALATIGPTWRVVTLDDASTEPVGLTGGLRAANVTLTVAARVGRAVGLVGRALLGLLEVLGRIAPWVLTAAVGWVWYTEGVDGLGNLAEEAFGPSFPSGLAARLIWVAFRVLAALLVAAGVVAAVITLILPLSTVLMSADAFGESLSKAESAKTRSVDSVDDAVAAAASAATTSRHALAPELSVLTVKDSVWRETVTQLARRADAVLIDVSVITENLLWEVHQALTAPKQSVVLVGRRDSVATLATPTSPAPLDPASALNLGRMRELLDGREILTYTAGLRGRRRFRTMLYAELESLRVRRAEGGLRSTLVLSTAVVVLASAAMLTYRLVLGVLG